MLNICDLELMGLNMQNPLVWWSFTNVVHLHAHVQRSSVCSLALTLKCEHTHSATYRKEVHVQVLFLPLFSFFDLDQSFEILYILYIYFHSLPYFIPFVM